MFQKPHRSNLYWLIIIAALVMGAWACGGGSSATPAQPEATVEPDNLKATLEPNDLEATIEPDGLKATVEPDNLGATSEPGATGDLNLSEMASDPAFSSSLTDQLLREDTLRLILNQDAKDGCRLSINKVEVTQPQDADGVWQEAWQMTICDTDYTYNITFTPSVGGGTDINITR